MKRSHLAFLATFCVELGGKGCRVVLEQLANHGVADNGFTASGWTHEHHREADRQPPSFAENVIQAWTRGLKHIGVDVSFFLYRPLEREQFLHEVNFGHVILQLALPGLGSHAG